MKIAVILKTGVDLPTQINASAHLCVGLQDLVAAADLRLRRFTDLDGRHVSTMTDYPLIVFSARNGRHLMDANHAALGIGVPCNAFFECMRGPDPDEQHAHVAGRPVAEQDYIGIALFGSPEQLRPLTRKFSLMRASGGGDTPSTAG